MNDVEQAILGLIAGTVVVIFILVLAALVDIQHIQDAVQHLQVMRER